MIHTSRTVTVGKMESIINEPIVLYRGDREVEVEFLIVGSKFMFTNGGNVIKSTNATLGQLVVNTPTGENMFSEVTECHEGKVVFVITKEMIDELVEVGFYSFQIRLFDDTQVSRVTIPPVHQGIDIRNPIAAEDETDLVDIGLVDYSVVRKNDFENVATFLPNGDYNKTNWESNDVISVDRLNKVDDALYEINREMKNTDKALLNDFDNLTLNVSRQMKDFTKEMEDEVEQIERDLNKKFGELKVDVGGDIRDRVETVETELEHIKILEAKSIEDIFNIESNDARKIKCDIELYDIVKITNKQNLNIEFTSGSIINFVNTSTWNDKYYDGSRWVYNTKNAITFDGLKNVTVRGLNLISDKENLNIKTFNGIYLVNCENVNFIDCTIDGFNWCGITFANNTCKNCSISNSRIYRNCYGIYNAGIGNIIENNIVTGMYSKSNEYKDNGNAWLPESPTYKSRYYDGIMEYGDNSIIINNYIQDNGQSGIYSSSVSNGIISNNIIEGNFNVGIDLGTVNNKIGITNMMISNNHLKDNYSNELNITGVADSIVQSNHIVKTDLTNPHYGIIIEGVSENNIITSNKIKLANAENSRGISFGHSTLRNKCYFNDILAKTKIYLSNDNKNFDFENPMVNFTKRITISPIDVEGFDGRAVIQFEIGDLNSHAQIITNKPLMISNISGVAQNINVGGLTSSLFSADPTNNVFWMNDNTKLRLPMRGSSPSEKGYLWFDSNSNKLVYSDGSGIIKVIATENNI